MHLVDSAILYMFDHPNTSILSTAITAMSGLLFKIHLSYKKQFADLTANVINCEKAHAFAESQINTLQNNVADLKIDYNNLQMLYRTQSIEMVRLRHLEQQILKNGFTPIQTTT